ncbi:MAG: adenylosuccinate lyase [Candidatus Diapherotrites archaeon]|nr:adenylosuccinate lyase [Candidatus Diapherotrites archaeon]
MDEFDLISPLDFRYISEKEKKLYSAFLSENARIKYQAKVELALVKVLARKGIAPKKAVPELEKAVEKISAKEVYEEEKKIKHDVRALVNCLRKKVSSESKPFIHFSATSYDIVDTSNALRYKNAVNEIILPSLIELEKELIRLALKYKKTPQIGRTHGQFAEPITFGFFIANYVDRLGNRINEIKRARNELSGKFSGAVGAYNASSLLIKNPEEIEKEIMKELGLKTQLISTQVAHPEQFEDLMHSLVSAFTVLANLADDMRNLQRSEINEIAEFFDSKQVGSSTMPHKRNPINFENVKSFWKQFMPRMNTVYLDAISEHQRDLTNSASVRFVPELFAGLSLSANRLTKTLKNIAVDKESMDFNLEKSSESIVAEPLYIILAKHCHTNAHEKVRELTVKAKKEKIPLIELAFMDNEIIPFLDKFSEKEIELLLNVKTYYGLSEQKTIKVCSYWKKELKKK